MTLKDIIDDMLTCTIGLTALVILLGINIMAVIAIIKFFKWVWA